MKLRLLAEDTNKTVHGYRTLPERPLTVEEAWQFLQKKSTSESYFSFEPGFYDYWDVSGRTAEYLGVEPGNYSNLVEVEFNLNDPNLGGYGDGQPFYSWIVGLKENPFPTLPNPLKNKIETLRAQITSDPEYNDDWSFAGVLPPHYKEKAIGLYRQARKHLSFKDVIQSGEVAFSAKEEGDDEFNYIGPYQDYINRIIIIKYKDKYVERYDPSTFDIVDEWKK